MSGSLCRVLLHKVFFWYAYQGHGAPNVVLNNLLPSGIWLGDGIYLDLEKCYDFEKKNGIERITKAVTNAMKINDNDSLIVQYIKEHTPENAIVFLTGIGKCYPILRSHKVLNNLHQAFVRCPVVMFFPGTYNEQELILFNEIKDDNYYRAFRLVR